MSVRPSILRLSSLGSLPASDALVDSIQKYEEAIRAIVAPVTNEEAMILVRLFGPDDCFGLAWSLLHLVETAPAWPIPECLGQKTNEWIQRLEKRAQNADLLP